MKTDSGMEQGRWRHKGQRERERRKNRSARVRGEREREGEGVSPTQHHLLYYRCGFLRYTAANATFGQKVRRAVDFTGLTLSAITSVGLERFIKNDRA